MKLNIISDDYVDLKTRLDRLRSSLAKAAQSVYDEWDQDDNGADIEFGIGGICDAISDKMGDVLSNFDINYTEGGHDGDDHSWLIAYDDYNAYIVDIEPSVYEIGGGMKWIKIPDVAFSEGSISIIKTDMPDWIDDQS